MIIEDETYLCYMKVTRVVVVDERNLRGAHKSAQMSILIIT